MYLTWACQYLGVLVYATVEYTTSLGYGEGDIRVDAEAATTFLSVVEPNYFVRGDTWEI